MSSSPTALSAVRRRLEAARTRAAAARAVARVRARDDDDPSPDGPAPSSSRFSTRSGAAGLLVPDPVFVLSSVRSGSTLLRLVLDSHSRICAPHEMHLGSLEVHTTKGNARKALRAMKLDERTLENLLWDRVLHIRRVESGKPIIVDKTPNTTLEWQRVAAFWPDMRPLLLLRHPLRIAESLIASRPDIPTEKHFARVDRYSRALHDAGNQLDGLTVRYEHLTVEPERVFGEICTWLGVEFEPAMLDYGTHRHDGRFKRGLGDWSDNIRSGTIQAPPPDPAMADVPEPLRQACRLLGYS